MGEEANREARGLADLTRGGETGNTGLNGGVKTGEGEGTMESVWLGRVWWERVWGSVGSLEGRGGAPRHVTAVWDGSKGLGRGA